MAVGAKIRIASVPSPDQGNTYIKLFYRALEPYGVEVVDDFAISDEALRSNRDQIDAIHLHWSAEVIWRSAGPTALGRARGVAGLWRWLRLAKSLGVRIIWTIHDIEPHEGIQTFDSLGYRILARNTDLCICHDEWSRDQAIARFGANPHSIVVMPHGNYDGVFPEPRSRQQLLVELDLDPSRRVLACLGGIRPYKGVELALDAMRVLDADFQLIVAGHAPDAAYGKRIAALASDLPNVRVILGLSDTQRFADLHGAADCVLMPYRKITGSGVLLSAITMGRGVVASDLPFFRAILNEAPMAGILYRPNTSTALAAAVNEFFTLPTEVRGAEARKLAGHYAWPSVVRPVGEWLQRTFQTPAAPLGMRNSWTGASNHGR